MQMDSPIAASSIHLESRSAKEIESVIRQMRSVGHRPDDSGEDQEVPLFATQEGLSFEEWDHFGEQIISMRTTNTKLVSEEPRWFCRIRPHSSRRAIRSRT